MIGKFAKLTGLGFLSLICAGIVRADMTFEQVCNLTTTMSCWDFEDEADLYYSHNYIQSCMDDPFLKNHPNGHDNFLGLDMQGSFGNVFATDDNAAGECVYPKRDETIAEGGNASLKFRIVSGSGPVASGDFHVPFKRFGTTPSNFRFARFGQGGEFWVRFSMRHNEAILDRNNFYTEPDGSQQAGVKRLIVHGYESSETLEETLQDSWQRRLPQMYSNSGTEDYGVQDVIGCKANDGGTNNFSDPDNYPEPPCRQFKSNKWQVFQIYVRVADNAPNFNNGIVRLYLDDEPTPIIEVRDAEMNASPRLQSEAYKADAVWDGQENGYGKLSFTLFSTRKARTAHPEGLMWVDNVIVSTTRVPKIVASPTSSDTTAPDRPTDVQAN